MMSEGYQRAGYEYLMLDDCWSSTTRTKDGRWAGFRSRSRSIWLQSEPSLWKPGSDSSLSFSLIIRQLYPADWKLIQFDSRMVSAAWPTMFTHWGSSWASTRYNYHVLLGAGPLFSAPGILRYILLQHPLQHLNGHPSKSYYYPRPKLLNFSDLRGNGILTLVQLELQLY